MKTVAGPPRLPIHRVVTQPIRSPRWRARDGISKDRRGQHPGAELVNAPTGTAPVGGGATSARAPVVCGALGRYRRERVLRIAAALGAGLRPVHEDEASILMLDRGPLRWSGRRQRGLGWIEGAFWRGGASDWREAARRLRPGHRRAPALPPLLRRRARARLLDRGRRRRLLRLADRPAGHDLPPSALDRLGRLGGDHRAALSAWGPHAVRRGPSSGAVLDPSPELRAWLAAPEGVELSGDLRLGMEAVSLFHAWWSRYRNRLREADAGELRG